LLWRELVYGVIEFFVISPVGPAGMSFREDIQKMVAEGEVLTLLLWTCWWLQECYVECPYAQVLSCANLPCSKVYRDGIRSNVEYKTIIHFEAVWFALKI